MKRRSRLALHLLLLGTFCPLSFAEPVAESRGVAVAPRAPDGQALAGDSWVFLVGINRYLDWPSLRGPVNDVKELKKVLLEDYCFELEHVLELCDENATKRSIMKTLSEFKKKLQPQDSLLIYFGGHGALDEVGVGWWIPYDGGKDKLVQENWISTNTLHGYMREFKCRHLLLLADSCFSGDLVAAPRGVTGEISNEFYRKAYERMSREVLTSGSMEEVPDTAIGNHSEFAFHLIRELESNTEPWMDPLKLYADIRTGIKSTVPLMGTLRNAGHQDGGSYLFFRRPRPADPAKAAKDKSQKGPIDEKKSEILAEEGEEAEARLALAEIKSQYFEKRHKLMQTLFEEAAVSQQVVDDAHSESIKAIKELMLAKVQLLKASSGVATQYRMGPGVIQEAKARVSLIEARLKEAEAKLERVKKLFDLNLETSQSLDAARFERDAGKAELDMAKKTLQKLEKIQKISGEEPGAFYVYPP